MGVCRKKKKINNHIQAYKVKFQHILCVTVTKAPHYLSFVVVDFYRIKGDSPLKWHANKCFWQETRTDGVHLCFECKATILT